MRPPPRPPPAHTPNFQPHTPPEAVHTPAGAGASHGGLAAPEKAVPRSPNKRPLPDEFDPRKVPGVWNVDGAPVASARNHLWGVEIPLPEGVAASVVEDEAWYCAGGMEEVAKAIHKIAPINTAAEDARRCMAAHALYRCASETGLRATTRRDAARATRAEALEAHSLALRAKWCADVTLTKKQHAALAVVMDTWTANARKDD